MVPAKHRSAQGAPGVAYVFHDICVLEDFHVRRGSYCKLRGCQTVDTTECFSREDRPSPAVLLMTETGYLSQEVGPSPDVFCFFLATKTGYFLQDIGPPPCIYCTSPMRLPNLI